MFYYKKGLIRRVRVHPKYIGGKHDTLQVARMMAKQDIKNNTFTMDHGYIIQLTRISDIGKGFCLPLHGFLEFAVTFDAVVLYPLVGEVVDAEVVMVTDTCITFRHVCVYGAVRPYSLNDQDFFEYEEVDKVAEAKKGSSGVVKEGLYRSKVDEEKVIAIGTAIRVRIIRRTLGGNGFFLAGSMCGEFLGPVKTLPPTPTMETEVMPATATEEDAGEKSSVNKSNTPDVNIVSHRQLQKLWEKEPYNTGKGSETPRREPELLPD